MHPEVQTSIELVNDWRSCEIRFQEAGNGCCRKTLTSEICDSCRETDLPNLSDA